MGTTYHLASADIKPAGRAKLVQSFEIPGQHSVSIYQRSANRFAVQYGMQVDDELGYEQAYIQLGASLMHAMSCAGQISNERSR